MQDHDVAIKVDGLSKIYRIGLKEKMHDTIGGAVLDFIKSPFQNLKKYRALYRFKDVLDQGGDDPQDVIWALKDASFEIKKGEVVGVIGRNGAGKSTLLKILSRITSPTTGSAEIHGRVGSLLEVGTGFHPELTGRENIYLNGSILGMRKNEIEAKFNDIVAFSGVGKFIDTPVKRYSSGMRVRVGFAVAAYLEPEILIIDEVLAVGDAEFQQKCIGKMQEVASEGRTVLFVSHNLGAVQALCTRGILISQGEVVLDAPVEETVTHYLGYLNEFTKNPFENNPERSGNGSVRFTSARILDASGNQSGNLIAGCPVSFEFEYKNFGNVSNGYVTMTIYNQMGIAATNFDMEIRGFKIDSLGEKGVFFCHVPKLPLPQGQYRVAAAIFNKQGEITDHIPNVLSFNVGSSTFFPTGKTPAIRFSTCMVSHEWKHTHIQ